MTGQMSLFDFIQDPEQEKKDRAKEWSAGRKIAEGYREGITGKAAEDALGGIEALKPAPPGIVRETAEERRKRAKESRTLPQREPCGRRCSVECFSKTCFIRRGYIWAPEQDPIHNWLRDENGKIIIGPKQCDWEPVNRICRTCGHFQKSVCGPGDIYHGVSCFGFGISRSQDPNQEACNDWKKATDGEPWRVDNKALNAWLGYEEDGDE